MCLHGDIRCGNGNRENQPTYPGNQAVSHAMQIDRFISPEKEGCPPALPYPIANLALRPIEPPPHPPQLDAGPPAGVGKGARGLEGGDGDEDPVRQAGRLHRCDDSSLERVD